MYCIIVVDHLNIWIFHHVKENWDKEQIKRNVTQIQLTTMRYCRQDYYVTC